MAWYLDSETINHIANDPTRSDWTEWEAGQRFHSVSKKLSIEHRDVSRIGTLVVAEMEGLEGPQLWMSPIEGSKKLLAPKSEVVIFDENGQPFYTGAWESSPDLKDRPKIFLWLKPRHSGTEELPLRLRALGFFRLLRHRIFRLR